MLSRISLKSSEYLVRAHRIWTSSMKVVVGSFALLFALSLLTIGKSSWPRTEPASAAPLRNVRTSIGSEQRPGGPWRADYGQLDGRMQQLMASKDMVGMAVAVIEHGQLAFIKGYGVTTAGGHERVTPQTVFRWASLSKGVAATLIGELADQKKLSLSDPVSRYATSLRLPKGSERLVTVDDLLSHRVGIVKNAFDNKLEEGVDPRQIRSMLASLDPYCPPGTCFAYQNVAFDAASEIVRKVTRQDYATAVRQRLFTPLGMTSASVTKAGLMNAGSWARPHIGQRTVAVEDAYYRVPAAGGVNSSILDLSRWMRAQMGESQAVLSRRVLATIHAPRVSTRTGRRGTRFDMEITDGAYALGWRDFTYAGHALIGHRGAVKGYRSLLSFDPATRSGVAILWNSQSTKPVGIQLELFDMLYGRPRHDWLELDRGKPKQRA